jgi:uncharacterized membrane protein
MNAHRFALGAAIILLQFGIAATAYSASFTGLGTIGGPGASSFPIDISANGRVVVGNASTGVDIGAGFRWTPRRGMHLLSEPADGTFSPTAVSANGRVIVGNYPNGYPVAYRWSAITGWLPLGDGPSDHNNSYASAVSGNGNVVVGASRFVEDDNSSASGWQAFIWMPNIGIQRLAPPRPDVRESNATAVSRNGKYVVGTISDSAGLHGFRWTPTTGLQTLLNDPNGAHPNAVSNSGEVIAGQILGVDSQAFRWTEAGGIERLGFLGVAGFHPSSAVTDMTADGSILVGYSHDGDADHPFESFVWDRERGMRTVYDALVNEYGLGEQMQGWTIIQGISISANGQFLAGAGRNPQGDWEAWRADLRATVIPEPETIFLAMIASVGLFAIWRGSNC